MIRYCLGFLFDEKENNIVLIRKLAPEHIKGKLNGVGGKIEDKESAIEAMEREFYEETGLKVPFELWKYKLSLVKQDEYEMHIFKANSPSLIGVGTKEKEEVAVYAMTSVLHPVNYLNCVGNLRWIIPMIMDKDLKFPIKLEEK
jgi:8-oxo-dGTP diphosphatase